METREGEGGKNREEENPPMPIKIKNKLSKKGRKKQDKKTLNSDDEVAGSCVSRNVSGGDPNDVEPWPQQRTAGRVTGQGHWLTAVVSGNRVRPGDGDW